MQKAILCCTLNVQFLKNSRGNEMKLSLSFLTILFCSLSLYAQNNMDDFVISEAKRYKAGGIAMLVTGTAMIGGGAAMISNESKNSKVMGAIMATAGVALDVGGILNIVKGKEVLETAKKTALYVSPNGVQFAIRF